MLEEDGEDGEEGSEEGGDDESDDSGEEGSEGYAPYGEGDERATRPADRPTPPIKPALKLKRPGAAGGAAVAKRRKQLEIEYEEERVAVARPSLMAADDW
eukprot:6198907-Prymnesium_polylepis.1